MRALQLGDRAERVRPLVLQTSFVDTPHRRQALAFETFRHEIWNVYNLARAPANAGATSFPSGTVDHATRPASIVHSDRLTRSSAARSAPPTSRSSSRSSVTRPGPKSPSMARAVSPMSSFSDSNPYPVFHGVKLCHIPETEPLFAPPPIECDEYDLDLGEARAESVFSRTSTAVGKSGKHVFGHVIKDQVWELSTNFSETSESLVGLRNAGTSRGRIIVLTIEAVTQQCKSAAGTKSAAKPVTGIARYFPERQSYGKVSLTGETSLVLLRDFLDQAASRGGTVPPTIRHSLCCWADALEIEWPIDRALTSSAVSVESNTAPKHSPAIPIETVKLLDGVATNKEVTPSKRDFAAGILLMSYASLRFADVQRLETCEVRSDSAHGTLLQCKKKPHGLDWRRACPRMGTTGALEWVLPLIEFRTAYARANGSEPCFTFHRIDLTWELESAQPLPYPTTRRKLAMLCVAFGIRTGFVYSTPPKNLFPTAANQMNFDARELNIIGHWSSAPEMPERYDRSVCATELLLRNTIIQKVVGGWAIAPSFHLPETVPSDCRIGKAAEVTLDTDVLPSALPGSLDQSAELSGQITPPLADAHALTQVAHDEKLDSDQK